MKDQFRTRLRGFLGTDHTKKILDQQIENQSLALLQGLMPQHSYLPYTIWGALPRTIVHILNDIVINRRTNIVEFGSGISTYFIARLIALNELPARFVSVDSNSEWLAHQQAMLNREGLATAELVHAPLKTGAREYMENASWYDEQSLLPHIHPGVDLVIADGPATDQSPWIRHHAVPFIRDFLADDYAIFLDDTNRPQEKAILHDWETLLGKTAYDYEFYGVITSEGSFNIDSIARSAYYY